MIEGARCEDRQPHPGVAAFIEGFVAQNSPMAQTDMISHIQGKVNEYWKHVKRVKSLA